MQQPFMYLDLGDGWQPVNDSANDVAALSSFSVRWGTDSPSSQPDPAVMTFTLLDRTGQLAGKSATLCGAKVIVQLSQEPRWMDMPDANWLSYGTVTNACLHQTYTPPSPDSPESANITIFMGIISTGGEATPHKDGWILSLTATSGMVLWKRLQSQGPTSSAARFKGMHWVGTPSSRLKELKSRAATAGAPTAATDNLILPPAVAPYSDDYPSQLDLLHRLFASSPGMPIWCEAYDRDSSRIASTQLADNVAVTADQSGRLSVTVDSARRQALPASLVSADESLRIPEPVTQIVLKTKQAKADQDGVLDFASVDTTLTDRGLLPGNLKATQSSITFESDTLTSDQSGGVWQDGSMWSPTDTHRSQAAEWLRCIDLRLRPQHVVFDGTLLDPADTPWLYTASPSGPFLIAGSQAGRLIGSDGLAACSGVWTTLGGNLTFDWHDGRPRITQEADIWPLPSPLPAVTWDDLADWPPSYDGIDVALSCADLATADIFETTATIQEGTS